MSEQGLKKMKIFNLAKELNLSSETIIDFPQKEGLRCEVPYVLYDRGYDACHYGTF
jgi:hypothetical protein